jgi:hypothetical protein
LVQNQKIGLIRVNPAKMTARLAMKPWSEFVGLCGFALKIFPLLQKIRKPGKSRSKSDISPTAKEPLGTTRNRLEPLSNTKSVLYAKIACDRKKSPRDRSGSNFPFATFATFCSNSEQNSESDQNYGVACHETVE